MDIILVVDFHEQLVGFYEITLVDVELRDIAVYAGVDVDELVGGDVGRVGEPDIEILFQGRDRAYCDHAGLLLVHLRTAAEAKDDQGRDGKEDDDPEGDDGVPPDGIHRERLRAAGPVGSWTSPVKKMST